MTQARKARPDSRAPGRPGGSWAGLRGVLLLVALVGFALPGRADEVDARPGPAPPTDPVALDSLLKLPDGFGEKVEVRQGATRLQWSERFGRVRTDLEEARQKLAEAEKELDSASGTSSAWQVSAPGAAAPEASPLSFRLRQAVKTQRNAIEDAERRLRALDVEADLAGVPQEWRH